MYNTYMSKEKEYKFDNDDFDDHIVELPRVYVRSDRNFNQYRRGDELIVELTSHNQALIDNGTFIEVFENGV